MIAISTPAQKPRGSASSTFWTGASCGGGHRVRAYRPRILGKCPLHEFLPSRPASAAQQAGIAAGDEIMAVNGEQLRDVIAYQLHADGARVDLEVSRGGLEQQLVVRKPEGAPLGLELADAIFDRVQTCDNHCPFCFIHQLPKGMRRNLYLQDDDFRLSFLYGNFTTLTRFTEADFERVITEKLSPLYVSIHATDPAVRTRLLRNPRGATSLRWLELLLAAGVEVHGQVVVCPGVNDGAVLDDTMFGVLDRFAQLADGRCRPVGCERAQPRGGDAPALDAGSLGRARHRSARGRRASRVRSAGGSCTRPTSTTSSRAGRSRASPTTTMWPSTRTASGWRVRSKRRSRPRWPVTTSP